MAGAGWRQFTVGQLLTSAQVQTFLQDQAVQVFASAAARTSALGTAVSAGMVSYRADGRALELYAGSAWQPVMQNQNVIIGGGFDIWQRGTSFTNPASAANVYTADRWVLDFADANPTSNSITRQTFTPSELNAAGFGDAQFYIRSTLTTIGSTTVYNPLSTRVEDVRTLAGQTVTLSFWAKTDSARNVVAFVNQVFGSGGSGEVSATPSSVTFAATTSWQRFSQTFVMPSVSGKTIGANSFVRVVIRQASASGSVLDVWGVQLEAGSVATPFVRAGGTLQGELAACQRYFYKMTSGYPIGSAAIRSSTLANPFIVHPVEMRTAPAFTASGTNAISIFEVGTFTSTALGTFGSTPRATILDVTSSGMTAGRAALATITSGQTIDWSAEL